MNTGSEASDPAEPDRDLVAFLRHLAAQCHVPAGDDLPAVVAAVGREDALLPMMLHQREPELAQVVLALDSMSRLAHLHHRRGRQRQQDGDDGDDYEELGQGEGATPRAGKGTCGHLKPG